MLTLANYVRKSGTVALTHRSKEGHKPQTAHSRHQFPRAGFLGNGRSAGIVLSLLLLGLRFERAIYLCAAASAEKRRSLVVHWLRLLVVLYRMRRDDL